VLRRALIVLVALGIAAGGYGFGNVKGTRADAARVPNLLALGTQGGGQAAASRELHEVGLRVGRVRWQLCGRDELGLVVGQAPSPGAVIPTGSVVNIVIGDNGTRIIGLFPDPLPPCLPGLQLPAGDD
jgi:beta-lactam-binding protein with PASTA domain